MRRKRSQSPLTPGAVMSTHRATRASSRSPKAPTSKAIISPNNESPHSPNCEANGHVSGHRHSRHTSVSSNKLSPEDIGGLEEISNCFRRSSRVNKGLCYHENESDEEKDEESPSNAVESRSRSLRRESSKRGSHDLKTTQSKRVKVDSQGNSRENHSFVTTDEDEDALGGRESPFLNHVRFSPSAKLGSPARSRELRQVTPASKGSSNSRQRSSRAAADVARIRLQNVPSEDEQFEFNRRYSRDLRRRKGNSRKKFSDNDLENRDNNAQLSPTRTTRISPRRAQGGISPLSTPDIRERRNKPSCEQIESNNISEDESHHEEKNKVVRKEAADEADDESQLSDEEKIETRKSSRKTLSGDNKKDKETNCNSTSPMRRSTRRRGSIDYGIQRERHPSVTDDDEKTEHHEEDPPIDSTRRRDKKNDTDNEKEDDHNTWVRRSSRQSKTSFSSHAQEDDAGLSDETHQSAENGVRRSKRAHHKPSFYDPVAYEKHQSTSEDEDEEEEDEEEEEEEEEDKPICRSQRRKSKRRRRSVERFAYEPAEPSRRRSSREHRRGQYSSDEEIGRGRGSNRRRRHDSQRRRPTNMNRMRDTSSSSSEDEIEKRDEASFQKRKTKRMNIERSKLMPLNFGKGDVNQAIFRERSKSGASMADISPMEINMNVTFESIGGLDEHVDKLREMVMFPLLYGEFFKKYNTNPPKGVLFYGPPGTGKTMMARALACECSQDNRKVAFFMRKGADCLSKWIGESERQLRLLFDQAYQMRPSIIFFDEIDGLAPVRSSRQDQIHSSIVSTLLALMDGLDDRGEIIIIGATNRIENIDPALRRPGRFDRELRFALPTQAARKDILNLTTKNWNPPINAELIELLSDKTIGYCGADLKGLCAEAPLNALRRRYPHVYKTNQKLALNLDEIVVREDDFLKAMKFLVPSTHRVQDQNQAPLTPEVKPLLQSTVTLICKSIEKIMPKQQCGQLCDDNLGSFYRPRLLIKGKPQQGLTTYIGPAILHAFETLPCHKLDITSLFSNAARSPEEALFHVIHEARRTIPSILYIPHFMKLWRNVMTGIHATLREALISLLSDIPPTAPLLILAIAEDVEDEEDDDSFPALRLFNNAEQVYSTQNPTEEERKNFFKPIFDEARRPPEELKKTENTYEKEALQVVPVADTRKLTEKEEKRLRRKEDALMRELRIFLRDIHHKINKEPKFFMFRVPVDTGEVYDYLDVVKRPMDFDQMQTKLDNHEYSCAQDFLDDIDLVAENAISYNGDPHYETNKVICHRARALQDFAYALVKAEMDTDFEDNCKDIVCRRKTLTVKLKKTEKDTEEKYFAITDVAEEANEFGTVTPNSHRKRKPKRKLSKWQRGYTPKPKKVKDKQDKEDQMETHTPENEEHASADEPEEVEQNGQLCENTDGACDLEDEDSRLSASALDISSQSVHETNSTFCLDEEQLTKLEKELLKLTKNLEIEPLERLHCHWMECVRKFKHRYDRTDLIPMMRSGLPFASNEAIQRIPSSPNRKGGRV